MTTTKKPSRRWVVRTIVSAVLLLAIGTAVTLMAVAWHFSGYVPDNVISLSGLSPLAVTTDGKTLIVGTRGELDNGFTTHVVGPIHFLDLATGKESQAPLELKEIGETRDEIDVSGAILSDDGEKLVVVQTGQVQLVGIDGAYFLTVFDLRKRSVILQETVPWTYGPWGAPSVQLSHDGRLLACSSTQDETSGNGVQQRPYRMVTVWDLDHGTRKVRLLDRAPESPFRFSSDGKLLATWVGRNNDINSGFQILNIATRAKVRPVKGCYTSSGPSFSPDGRFVACCSGGGNTILDFGITVLDTASGKPCFDTKGCRAQFLPGGALLCVRGTGRPMPHGDGAWEIPEIAVWSTDGWREMGVFPYNLGVSPLTGPHLPGAFATGRGNEFALIYDTNSNWWTGSPKGSSNTAVNLLGRALQLNVPRGIGLDVVDPATAITKTYHLDSGDGAGLFDVNRCFVFPQAGKILVPRSDGQTATVWSIPPRKSYRAVKMTACILAAVGIVACALILVVRLVWRLARRYRGRQQSAARPLEVQL